ncbi:MAG: hypothetical protein ACREVN_01725 [Gammaproteobacteria bacterium]
MLTSSFNRAALAMTCAAILLAGCSSGGSSSDDAVVVEGDFPVVFAKRAVGAVGNPTDGAIFEPGGDLFKLDLSSPSAAAVNLTGSYTQGTGDVSDPEVSYDATRVLFSMRGPNDPTWNVWEYDLVGETLTRVIADDAVAELGDDVDPAYLPDGRIVFSSNRQERSKEVLAASGIEPYAHLDEYERERAIVLHVMNADGTDIHQISFNQSHDRNPTVLSSGEVMFARWDHVGGRNHFPIFFTNPDGTNIFVQYGAFSPGNSFLHPREMPGGRVLSALMPLSGTREGGAVVAVDIRNFSENDQPSPGAPAGAQGQVQVTPFTIEIGDEISENGRYTTPYPLWDGTNRALVSWSPFRPEMETDPLTGEEMEVEGTPLYGIYMLDMDADTLRPIALPEEGFAFTDAIPIQPRPAPNTISDKPLNAALAAENMGILNVKSIYDTDFLDIMGDSVLVPGEALPATTPPPDDMRSDVADIAMLKDPAMTMAAERPGRFVRVTKAAPTPGGLSREIIGETELEMQQIVGYSEVEPDGSVRIKVPADTALTLAVVDAEGRALQTHTNWLQVRPGETRTCNGCHSPRRGSALNSAPIAGLHPNTLMTAESGESMAETRTRLDPAQMELEADLVFTDVWTDPVMAGRAPDADMSITYAGLATPAPAEGIINYPEHIQPLWELDRGANTCTDCHASNDLNDPLSAGLDLRGTIAGTGRLLSYEELMIGDPIIDPITGLPQLDVTEDGEIMIAREAPLVATGSSDISSRTSHLVEKIFEQELRAVDVLPAPTVDHSGFLNDSETRLIAEWIDIGGQYFNDPFEDADNDGFRSLDEVRGGVAAVSESVFESTIQPMLLADCAGCHRPFGGTGAPSEPPNPGFLPSRFVLTGSVEGDFNVTLTMIDDVCQPAESALLKRPVSDEMSVPPHPRIDDAAVADDPNDPAADDVTVLTVGDSRYQTLFDWVAAAGTGCP